MKRIIVLISCMFLISQVFAMKFKVCGSQLYFKQDSDKSFGDYSFLYIRGVGYIKDNKFVYIFEDKSDITRMVDDSYHKKLEVYKRDSKWIVDYDREVPFLYLVYPNIEAKRFRRDYIKQIYP